MSAGRLRFSGTRVRVAPAARVAEQDPLTGLANRFSYTRHLEGALGRAASTGTGVSLLLIDLDRFKEINARAAEPRGPAGRDAAQSPGAVVGCQL